KFQEKYIELHQLAEGNFGSVYAGYRVKDKLPVAIKHVQKHNMLLKHEDENGREMALELAVMLKLRTMGQSGMVFLLDWYNLDQELILVMERPMPSDDLSCYIMDHGGSLKMKEAKVISTSCHWTGFFVATTVLDPQQCGSWEGSCSKYSTRSHSRPTAISQTS
ncbi:hypothetical protein XENOCAPTIV_030408, partial [Xenoophorus captivus]